MRLKPDLLTRLEFGKKGYIEPVTVVEVTADKEDAMIHVRESNDQQGKGHNIFLKPDEIDLFISILTLYKNRILNPKRRDDDEY